MTTLEQESAMAERRVIDAAIRLRREIGARGQDDALNGLRSALAAYPVVRVPGEASTTLRRLMLAALGDVLGAAEADRSMMDLDFVRTAADHLALEQRRSSPAVPAA